MGKIPESTSFKISDFIFRFRESSQRFVVEILTQNFAFNLSGTLFFIGLGCSLKWWYKDQLLITLLKQNLPAFSQPQQKISWETGEYLIGEQTRQFLIKKQKNNEIVMLPNLLGTFNEHERSCKGVGLKNSEMDLFFTPQVQNVSPYSFSDLIDRVDVYSNSLVINFRSPWQKHAYHRFVGLFPELICADTAHTSSMQVRRLPSNIGFSEASENILSAPNSLGEVKKATSSSSIKFVPPIFQKEKYTFLDIFSASPPKNWFKLSARGLCILNDASPSSYTPGVKAAHLPASPFQSKIGQHTPRIGTELVHSRILNKGLAELSVIVNYPTIKTSIKEKTSPISSKVDSELKVQRLAELNLGRQTTNFSYPLELTQKMNGWQPPVQKIILNSYLDEIPYKLENTQWATTGQIGLSKRLSNRNGPLRQYSGDVKKKDQTLIKSTKTQQEGAKLPLHGRSIVNDSCKEDKQQMHSRKRFDQLIEIKQVLINELQILANSLPVIFVDRSNSLRELNSSRSASNNQANNIKSHIRDAQKKGTWLTPNSNSLQDWYTFDVEQIGSLDYNALLGASPTPLSLPVRADEIMHPRSKSTLVSPLPSATKENNISEGKRLFDVLDIEESPKCISDGEPLMSSTSKSSPLEMHLENSFSLLNSLGITFNNLSYLKDPPVLLRDELRKIENINPVDTQVSLTNKRVRLMSGYIYPDTSSASLMQNFYRWTYSAFSLGGTCNTYGEAKSKVLSPITLDRSTEKQVGIQSRGSEKAFAEFVNLEHRRCKGIKTGANTQLSLETNKGVTSSQLMKKINLFSIDGDKNLTPLLHDCLLYSKKFQEINRLRDNACLFKVCTSGTPTTIGCLSWVHPRALHPGCIVNDNCQNKKTIRELPVNSLDADKLQKLPCTLGAKHKGAQTNDNEFVLSAHQRCNENRCKELKANRVEQWNFNHHLGSFPGFLKPNQFILSLNQIAQGNDLSKDLLTHFYDVSLNSNTYTSSAKRNRYGVINSVEGVHEIKQNQKGSSFQPFDCSPRKTVYNGIVVQRNPFTKDFQLSKKKLVECLYMHRINPGVQSVVSSFSSANLQEPGICRFPSRTLVAEGNTAQQEGEKVNQCCQCTEGAIKEASESEVQRQMHGYSLLGTFLFGPENPFTDRQSHFFGQRRLSTVDVNMFQRDYLRQLGSETLLQSNPKEFTYGTSVERVKILSFSKAINSFLSNKRRYTYLLEENDQWHLLFQEQLRTALEDTRKYPHLTPEEFKDHNPGRIKVSAPLMMARFPKKSNCHKVLAHYSELLDKGISHGQITCGEPIDMHHISSAVQSRYTEDVTSEAVCAPLRASEMQSTVYNALFTETYSSQHNSALLLDQSSFAMHFLSLPQRGTNCTGNNNFASFLGQQWFTQEPLNANSWLIISQWSFLVALLFWIEQTFLADIFPALFALEQLLLGTTGMKSDDRTHVTRVSKGEIPKFKDIAGIDGLLGELAELVLFLRGHKKRLWNKKSSYGVLLTGPPGTGKTFLVRALANEAKVPVLILSAGVLTANKTNNSKPSWSIRHAFRRAKQLAPCILFIDEIDALGRSRGNIVTDINEIVASAPGGQNVQATPLSNSNFFEMKNSFQFHLPSVEPSCKGKATLANTSLQQQLLSATETQVHQIQGTKSLRELASQGKSISAYNQIDRYSLCADTSWLINASFFTPTLGSETKIPSIGDKTLSTGSYAHASNQPVQSMQTKGNIKRKFGPLTQLLVSMDGVSSLAGVLIIGATNRPESLDPALTRPGRFERIIRVEKPAEQKRIEILKLYSRNLGIQKQIPWSYLANRTMGLTAADLAVAMNYSSLKAILQGTMHTIETIEYGLDSIARFSSKEVQQKKSVINTKSTENAGMVTPSSKSNSLHDCASVVSSFSSANLLCIYDAQPSICRLQRTSFNRTLGASTAKVSLQSNLLCDLIYNVNDKEGAHERLAELNNRLYTFGADPMHVKAQQSHVPNSPVLKQVQVLQSKRTLQQIIPSAGKKTCLHQRCMYINTIKTNYDRFKAQWVYKGCIDAQFNKSICTNKCLTQKKDTGGVVSACLYTEGVQSSCNNIEDVITQQQGARLLKVNQIKDLKEAKLRNDVQGSAPEVQRQMHSRGCLVRTRTFFASSLSLHLRCTSSANMCNIGSEKMHHVIQVSGASAPKVQRQIGPRSLSSLQLLSCAPSVQRLAKLNHRFNCTTFAAHISAVPLRMHRGKMLPKVNDSAIKKPAVNSISRSIVTTRSCISDAPPSPSTSDLFSLTTKTNKIDKKRLQRLTQIAYYQSGKIVVQTLLPLHPPVALITLNLSGTTTATSADTYIPIDNELNTYWSSFLESRLMGLYGGKASSLLLNRQQLLPIFLEKQNSKDDIVNALPSDKPDKDSRLPCIESAPSTLRFNRFSIDPLGRSKRESKQEQEYLYSRNGLGLRSRSSLDAVQSIYISSFQKKLQRGNLFHSNIGTEENQTATFLAVAMVNRWALSYSCTFGSDCCFYRDYLHSSSNDSEERYHSSLENDKPLLFTRATYCKQKNKSQKKGTKRHLETLASAPTSFRSLGSLTFDKLALHSIRIKPVEPLSPMRKLGCIEGVLDSYASLQKVMKMFGKSKKFVSSFTKSIISKAEAKNYTYLNGGNSSLLYSPGRFSVENVAITIPLRTHVFQLVNPLQFSISQRDRFYPGWFRLYLPDIEATEFMKNVANYYYSQGLQTLTRSSSIFDQTGAVDIDNPLFLVDSFSKKNRIRKLPAKLGAVSASLRKTIISDSRFNSRSELNMCNQIFFAPKVHIKESAPPLDKSFRSLPCSNRKAPTLRYISSIPRQKNFETTSFLACSPSAPQKLPFDYNDAFFLDKELIYHSLVNNCFSKAFFLIDQNRQLTDFFADYLIRFQILRQHQILYLFSTVLFNCKKQT